TVAEWPFADFYRWCLFESPAGPRLGALRDQVWALIERGSEKYRDSSPLHLVHGDFNPTNLLIGAAGDVTAVLDWEFAHSGKLWSDIGNLLRRRAEFSLPVGFESVLAEGLTEGGVTLPVDWRERALFDDLSSACEFLSSEEERPVTHTRALRQIEDTLLRLSL
ncbi:MAG TPA: phosphotransferase, partial [Polyangiaceae bacterium]|nr:phosphotransferase [Polyangiaceae bacterium]